MKIYYNEEKNQYYCEGKTITWRVSESNVFSGIPSEEQLLEWGFVEYTPPAPEPYIPTLEDVKESKKQELSDYDQSNNVNAFIFNGQHMWLAPEVRSNYMLTIEGAKRLGVAVVPFLGIEIPVDSAQTMLDLINIYAMRCVAVTDAHKASIEALDTIEAVEAYDFTVGYPKKVNCDEIIVANN